MHDLIRDPVIRAARRDGSMSALSLPELLAEMAVGGVLSFPALRAHQRAAWHMFLVQLACAALWKNGRDKPARDAETWSSLLRSLTAGYPQDEPWRLVPPNRDMPGFLQPPDPGGLRWERMDTPEGLDILVTARNHDVKSAVAVEAKPEDWIFALVTMQTMSGHGGRNNYGIVRMNGGASSRALVGLAPGSPGELCVDPSAWWTRDVLRLLEERRLHGSLGPGIEGGPVLLWLLDWPEMEQLRLEQMDPWFIEVCRRVRLDAAGSGRLHAYRSTSRKARIDPHLGGRRTNGVVGDPWMPVNVKEKKSLTLSPGDFDWQRMCSLLFSEDWELPPLARRGPGEDRAMLLIAENLNRGQGKTAGFRSRILPVPPGVLHDRSAAAGIALRQAEEVDLAGRILRHAVALFSAGGERDAIGRNHFDHASPASRAFNGRVDRFFFHHLWERVENDAAHAGFHAALRKAAVQEFENAVPVLPCPAFMRPRARVRARAALHGRLRREFPAAYEDPSEQRKDPVNA